MGNQQYHARIQNKYDTDANWTANNPVLLQNELIWVETDEGVKMKRGDGVTAYTGLDFLKIGDVYADSELNETSENPVQNKTVAAAIGNIGAILDEINGEVV